MMMHPCSPNRWIIIVIIQIVFSLAFIAFCFYDDDGGDDIEKKRNNAHFANMRESKRGKERQNIAQHI
jgi:hypothetical protein